jgi:hypothetical protein
MASKFVRYGTASCEESLFRMYTFIASSGQTALQFVNNTGSAIALYKQGTGFVTSWSSSSDCPDGSYFVIEPVTVLGSARWQAKFTNASADTLKCLFSVKGGWTNAAQNFGANPVTPDNGWNDGAAPGVGSQVYCATGTFAIDGSNTGTYAWFNLRDTSAASADQFVYVGNHVPLDIAVDTRPTCLVQGIPLVTNASFTIGRDTSDSTNVCRTPVEVAQTTSLVSAGYARVGYSDSPGTPGSTCIWRDRGGKYLPAPAFLFLRNTALVGHFGEHLRICDGSLNDYDTDTGNDYIVIGHLWLHWDETL